MTSISTEIVYLLQEPFYLKSICGQFVPQQNNIFFVMSSYLLNSNYMYNTKHMATGTPQHEKQFCDIRTCQSAMHFVHVSTVQCFQSVHSAHYSELDVSPAWCIFKICLFTSPMAARQLSRLATFYIINSNEIINSFRRGGLVSHATASIHRACSL